MTPLKFYTTFISDNIYEQATQGTEDVLAKFYGQFIRYSGGDGQSLGIVLTPNHITDLFTELLDLKYDDVVFDPCCGTGSFLLSSMNYMIKKCKTDEDKLNVKKNQLHGIESKEDMFSIATTNMILRGDGKSNLIRDDFLSLNPDDLRDKGFTVGLMNPPYSQCKNKETSHLSEISFTEHLLNSLKDNADCAVIVPTSTMIGKNGDDRKIKQRILRNHTLVGVITLNPDTFKKGTHTCIAVFRAHVPHNKDNRVKFIDFKDDGYELHKHIGLVETPQAVDKHEKLLRVWFDKEDAGTDFIVKSTVKASDEWLHSYFYFIDTIPDDEKFTRVMGDYLSFEFDMIMQGREYLFNEED